MSDVNRLCSDIENALRFRSHQPAGPMYKNIRKRHASICFKRNEELKGILSLTESHAPTYRIKTTYRYDKVLKTVDDNIELTMNKDFVSFDCPASLDNSVKSMIEKISELPKEWTIIQLTSQFNLKESIQQDISTIYTDPLHVTVFNCGQNTHKPFCVNLTAPSDISGEPIELCKEMRSIIDENKNLLFNYFGSNVLLEKISVKQKKAYSEHRSLLNNRLKDVINQIEKNWLGEWRCLLVGKFVDEKVEMQITNSIDTLINEENSGFQITDKVKYLLSRIVAGGEYLTGNEILKAIHHCMPEHKGLKAKIYKAIIDMSNSFKFKTRKRYPVILIIDEKLDFFPWEMIDVLIDHPVSRMPSLHFAYALYKEHEKSVINGYKHVNSSNGTYMINPGLDLKKMETRLKEFFKYWLPEWKGLVGQTPSSEEFSEYLTSGDIFVYNGHGSGTQFLSANKIQQMRVNSVVLLFGCSSVRMNSMGPFVEMYDVFHNYLIACSPCVVGMLWEVTDFDTDLLSTSILSHWIPSKADTHWKNIDKAKWEKGAVVPLSSAAQKQKTVTVDREPELLRAINIAEREPIQFITKCAIVARGLPVKIVS